MPYPSQLDHRLAYDVDGTRVFYQTLGMVNPVELTQAELQTWNNENAGDGFTLHPDYPLGGGWNYVVFHFPEPMVLSGYYLNFWDVDDISSSDLSWSNDALAMFDGTWTVAASPLAFTDSWADAHRARADVQGFSTPSCKSLRLYYYNSRYRAEGDRSIHLYGHPTALGAQQRLVLWDAAADQRIPFSVLDWGDVYRGQTYTRQFRVKNTHSALSATGVVVGMGALTAPAPTLSSQMLFSVGAGSPTASLSLGTLAPGAVSAVVTVTFSVVATAQVGPWVGRVSATPTGWV